MGPKQANFDGAEGIRIDFPHMWDLKYPKLEVLSRVRNLLGGLRFSGLTKIKSCSSFPQVDFSQTLVFGLDHGLA